MQKRRLSPDHRERIAAAQTGPLGNNWRGGRIVREGRVLIYVGREHPMADSYGYAYEHRLVVAARLGRPLDRAEHVHHVNGDEGDNRSENLVLVTLSQHRRIHNLIRAGLGHEEAVREVLG